MNSPKSNSFNCFKMSDAGQLVIDRTSRSLKTYQKNEKGDQVRLACEGNDGGRTTYHFRLGKNNEIWTINSNPEGKTLSFRYDEEENNRCFDISDNPSEPITVPDDPEGKPEQYKTVDPENPQVTS